MKDMLIIIYSYLGRFTLLLAFIFGIALMIDREFLDGGLKSFSITCTKVIFVMLLSLGFAGCVFSFL